ncbi:MAG: hypothetical protein KDA85_02225 [Planctomycetaceae bacterium]|nr:hypothetical protein [Planctomycetaceae bacterium]
MTPGQRWLFLIVGYFATVAIELPILVALLRGCSRLDRVKAGFLLTAFSYPIVVLVIPALFAMTHGQNRISYLAAAETTAPLMEILLYRLMIRQPVLARPDRNAAVIVVANLCSFLLGEWFVSARIHAWIDAMTPGGR